MLQHLSINNYALIDSLEIDFLKGFSVITGETGSGKSILLGALKLILGQRADSKVIYDSSRKCIIEAIFDISHYKLSSFFKINDLDYDPTQTIIRREIYANGKSRAFINDCPAKLNLLKDFSNKVIDIHSQHQSLLLNSSNYQLELIDTLASINISDHNDVLNKYRKDLIDLKNYEEELLKISHEKEESKNQLDYLLFLNSELKDANLSPKEKETHENTISVYENCERITTTLKKASFIIDKQEYQAPINSQLNDLLNDFKKISNLNDMYHSMTDRFQSILIELSDISKECDLLLSKIENSNFDIHEATQRLNLINQLEQKHRVNNYEELLQKQKEIQLKVENLLSADDNVTALEKKIMSLKLKLNKSSKIISKNRALVCPEIESFINKKIAELGIKNGQFKVSFEKLNNQSTHGKDRIKFLFSANKGARLKKISDVASGGEVSRLMLTIKALLAKHLKLPCLILDEIDSGVSGEVASKISKILLDISKEIQVIVITHLPQVASKADFHYKVEKFDDNKRNRTIINKLNDNDRISELAKMLSGETITSAAIENAKALISNH